MDCGQLAMMLTGLVLVPTPLYPRAGRGNGTPIEDDGGGLTTSSAMDLEITNIAEKNYRCRTSTPCLRHRSFHRLEDDGVGVGFDGNGSRHQPENYRCRSYTPFGEARGSGSHIRIIPAGQPVATPPPA